VIGAESEGGENNRHAQPKKNEATWKRMRRALNRFFWRWPVSLAAGFQRRINGDAGD
jgi:hypothetical protein